MSSKVSRTVNLSQHVEKAIIEQYRDEYYYMKSEGLHSHLHNADEGTIAVPKTQVHWLFPLLYIVKLPGDRDSIIKRKSKRFSLKNIFMQILKQQTNPDPSSSPKQGNIINRYSRCCYLCYCLIRLCYLNRNKVLTFQTPQTKGTIHYLGNRPLSEWNTHDVIKVRLST